MSFTVYILHSIKLDKYYIGQTIDLAERIDLHNTKFFKSSFTAKANDWKLIITFACDPREEPSLLKNILNK